MSHYRLYRLDGAGRISTAEWLEAEDDKAAAARAAELCDGDGAVELWARNRLIARVDPSARDQLGASGPLEE